MDAQDIARYYPLPDAEYLRGELETLQNDFRAFEESIADGPPCICFDNPDPPKGPIDNPSHKDPEINKDDTSAKGLRAALDQLTRRATAMRTAQDEGAACVCPGKAGAEAKTGTETVTGTPPRTRTGIRTEVGQTGEGGPKTPREGLGGPGAVEESPYVPPGPFGNFTFASLGLGTGTSTRTGIRTEVVQTGEGGPQTPRESFGGPGVFESPLVAQGPYDGFTFANLGLG